VKTAFRPDQLILNGPRQIAFAGRSNVGKSSLLNRLFNRKNLARVSQTPGKTQSINFFLINDKFYFVDLPGYGYARAPKNERERWRALADRYFQECKSLAGLVHLIDIRHEPTALDLELIEWTDGLRSERIYVLTKADKLSRNKQMQAAARLREMIGVPANEIVTFSAETGVGKTELLERVAALV
jgi:GTP-binding protein